MYNSSQKSNINRHIKSVHEGKKQFECQVCDSYSSLKADMTKLVKSIHDEKRLFEWELCSITFSNKDKLKVIHLKTHVRSIHEGKKGIKCEICDYSSSHCLDWDLNEKKTRR